MQQKTLLTLICAVYHIISYFVELFGFCLFNMCCSVQHYVKMLYLACTKKHVHQESVSQLEDFYNKEVCKADTQADIAARHSCQANERPSLYYSRDLALKLAQDDHDKWLQTMEESENTPNVFNMAGLSKVDLNQTHYRGAVTIIASVAWSRAVQNVKSERAAQKRAENNAAKSSCSDNIAANPRAYAQGTWQATRTGWTGTKP